MSTAEYTAMLEDPSRAEWQKPADLVAALGLHPGMHVADVGTGSGYFLPFLARAVAPGGSVVGEDIDPALLAFVQQRIAREHLAGVTTLQGDADDPRLAVGAFDCVLLVDTYHHIENRPVFLAHVRAALAPTAGRFVVVDFRDGPLPVGPEPAHKIPRAQIEHEVESAGFVLIRTFDLLRYQFVLEFAPRPT